MLNNGANIDAQNNKGTTALSFATQYNQVEVVKLLIARDADITIIDQDNKIALDHAKEKELNEIISLLEN